MHPKRETFVNQLNQANQMQVNNGDTEDSENLKKIKTLQTNYWSKSRMNGWTPARRKKQAEMIRKWQPWKHSTGPKTEAGKQQSCRNAYKHGGRCASTRQIHRLMAEYARMEREARLLLQ